MIPLPPAMQPLGCSGLRGRLPPRILHPCVCLHGRPPTPVRGRQHKACIGPMLCGEGVIVIPLPPAKQSFGGGGRRSRLPLLARLLRRAPAATLAGRPPGRPWIAGCNAGCARTFPLFVRMARGPCSSGSPGAQPPSPCPCGLGGRGTGVGLPCSNMEAGWNSAAPSPRKLFSSSSSTASWSCAMHCRVHCSSSKSANATTVLLMLRPGWPCAAGSSATESSASAREQVAARSLKAFSNAS